ncbi:MAG: OmpA family protein [Gammaproteobacteria bacterium]|nr:OmpA family protein [Gammaproteobacteria bacterium]
MNRKNHLIQQRLVVFLLSTTLIACASTNPYTGEKEISKTTQGSLWGALGGALLGAATASKKERKKRALQGAGIGAVAGGSVGYYMDQQEEKLRKQLKGTGVSVSREGDSIVLNMPSNITFDTNSANLKSRFNETLNSVVLVLNEYQSTLITAMGHTDSTGSNEYNQSLSERRALAVANYFINKGVAQERLAAIGYGENQPIASNTSANGRSVNRRVELKLDPVTPD